LTADVFEFCAAEVRRHDRERFQAALFAPEAGRRGLIALYAFNLEIARVRERVTEPLSGAVRLQWWRDALEQIFAGHPPRHDVCLALSRTIEAAGLPRAPFEALIDARHLDLEDEPVASAAALASYAQATASGLVRLAVQVLTRKSLPPALLAAADAAGRAWGFTGLLRALPIHAARHQLFLPADRLSAEDKESLFARRLTPALAQTMSAVARSARLAFSEARVAYAEAETPGALPAFLTLTLVPPMLARVERPGFDPFRDTVELPPIHRLLRLVRAALRGSF
jgi:phytoene synthase